MSLFALRSVSADKKSLSSLKNGIFRSSKTSSIFVSCIFVIFFCLFIPPVAEGLVEIQKCSPKGVCRLRLKVTQDQAEDMLQHSVDLFEKYKSEEDYDHMDDAGLLKMLIDMKMIVSSEDMHEEAKVDEGTHDDHHDHSHHGHDHKKRDLSDEEEAQMQRSADNNDDADDHAGHDHHGHDHSEHAHEDYDYDAGAPDRVSISEKDRQLMARVAECPAVLEFKQQLVNNKTHSVWLTYDQFFAAIPAITLFKIKNAPCVINLDQNDDTKTGTAGMSKKSWRSDYRVWLIAMVSNVVISLLSIIGLLTVPIMRFSRFYGRFMALLIAMAVGTLIGDAILHLLPHATAEGGHEGHEGHNHSAWGISKHLMVVGGIYIFFLFETVMKARRADQEHKKALKREQQQSAATDGAKDSQEGVEFQDSSLGVLLPQNQTGMKLAQIEEAMHNKEEHVHVMVSPDDIAVKTASSTPMSSQDGFHQHHHHHDHEQLINGSILDMAWMVIVGDGLHNFSDGLAIGAAFSSTIAAGLSTSFAIFLHELPHELGDFAVLVEAGMSIKQALLYNVMSACLAFIGTIIGLVIGEYTADFKLWVLALTAGGFLYVALVNMLPELIKKSSDRKDRWKFILTQVGFLFGVSCMLLIALYEDAFQSLF